jgi:hypothetical protein
MIQVGIDNNKMNRIREFGQKARGCVHTARGTDPSPLPPPASQRGNLFFNGLPGALPRAIIFRPDGASECRAARGGSYRFVPAGTAWDRIKFFLHAKVGRKIGARIGGRVLRGHNPLVASEKVGLFRITQKAGLWEQGKNTFRRDAETNLRDAGATRRTIQRKSLISHLTRRNKMAE